MTPPGWDGVMMDTHIYQMFSVAVSFSAETPRHLFSSLILGKPNEQLPAYIHCLQQGRITI